jgi:hypothetical protein
MVKGAVSAGEKGQAVLLVVLAMGVFLMGALGIAVDGSQLYAQRQMAQLAADAAAQAGIVTIFNGSTAIGTSAYYCTSSDTTSPCTYVSKNNFTAGATACTALSDATPGADCIKVDPNPGVAIPGLDPGIPSELQVSITRAVPTTILKMMGFNSFKVSARATAAIVDITAAIPIIVTQPWQGDSFDLNSGSSTITISGGPQRSIQVNSNSSTSMGAPFHPQVDLHLAGPSGTGGDFGDFGGPSGGIGVLSPAPASTNTIHWIQPADPIDDPLSGVSAPSQPGATVSPLGIPLADGAYGCPSPSVKPCLLYFPGTYTSNINVQNNTAVFAPGIYYMTASSGHGAGFYTGAHGYVQMATGLSDTSSGPAAPTYSLTATAPFQIPAGGVTSCCGTGTSWDGSTTNGGVMFYFTGPSTTVGSCTVADTGSTGGANPKTIDIGSNGDVGEPPPGSPIIGSPISGPYKGILFFIDHNADSRVEKLGGGGNLVLYGTVYATDSKSQMGTTSSATCSSNQTLFVSGNSGNTTQVTGEIITSLLRLGGTGGITMNLNPNPFTIVRQIALVNGE